MVIKIRINIFLTIIFFIAVFVRIDGIMAALPPDINSFFYIDNLKLFTKNSLLIGIKGDESSFPLFYWVLKLFLPVFDYHYDTVIRIIPGFISSLAIFSIYFFIKNIEGEKTALLASFFYATNPLMIKTSFSYFCIIYLILPVLLYFICNGRFNTKFSAVVVLFTLISSFSFLLFLFILYAYIFSFGIKKIIDSKKYILTGLIPLLLWILLHRTIISSDIYHIAPKIDIISFGFSNLFILFFLEYFKNRPKTARFFVIFSAVCFFGYVLGEYFTNEFLIIVCFTLIFMSSIAAVIFLKGESVIIYRLTTFIAILSLILIHSYNVFSVSNQISVSEYEAIKRLSSRLPDDSMIFSDIYAMQAIHALSDKRVLLTQRDIYSSDLFIDKKTRYHDYITLLFTENFGCEIIRNYNITHFFSSKRINNTYPFSIKYATLPAPDDLVSGDNKFIPVQAVCRIKNA